MFKVALFATTVLAAASMAAAENPVSEPAIGVPATASCHPGTSLDLACAMRAVDADGNGVISAGELANLAVPLLPVSPAADWAAMHPASSSSLVFQDAVADSNPMPSAPPAHDSPKPLIPALLALGALVILLRKRPT